MKNCYPIPNTNGRLHSNAGLMLEKKNAFMNKGTFHWQLSFTKNAFYMNANAFCQVKNFLN